jgi:hypothetical protein
MYSFLFLTGICIIQGVVVPVRIFLTCIVIGISAIPGFAFADDSLPAVAIHGNQFEPKQLTIPQGVKHKLVIQNFDSVPVEFESYDLSREVIVPGHGEVTIFVGPLEPGNYLFFNDFNHEMQGTIIVKPTISKEN